MCVHLLIMLQKVTCGGSGCSPLKSPQAGQVGRKECLLYFRCLQLGGGWQTSVPRLTPHPTLTSRGERFRRQSWGGRLHAETAPPSLTVIFSWRRWSDQHHLTNLGRVHLQFQGTLVPSSLGSILRIVAAQVLGTV